MTAPHLTPYDSVLDTVGWTPLIRLARVGAGLRTPVYGKAEYANPGGSVKDRIGLAIIEDAERRGELRPGGTVVEGTSGNTGVGLAIAAALKGYRCIFTMPDKMSQEKVRLLKAYGAEVVITPTAVPPDHPDNYVMKAKQIVKDTPGAFLANQFYNQTNPAAHYATTGPEIWEQTGGRVTHLVAGAGTGGTVSGAGKYLKERNPDIRVIAGDPVGSLYTGYAETERLGEGHPYKVEGIGGDKVPTTVWFDQIDEWRQLSDKASMAMLAEMYWKGLGVPADRPIGYAWMDLAAERLYANFTILRERYWRDLSPAEQELAIERGQALLAEFGDAKAKPRLERVLRLEGRKVTGSRVGSVGFVRIVPMTGPAAGTGKVLRASDYYRREYWEPKQYWAWQDQVWQAPRQENVDVGDVEQVPEGR